jgi:hypothetical protein
MKNNWLGLIVLALALVVNPTRAGAQDKTSKIFIIIVGHIVTIGWTASTTPNVTYNVYVSSVRGGPYLKIGHTAGTFFGDIDGTSGNTYFYVITAVDAAGNESINSTEVSVVLPN